MMRGVVERGTGTVVSAVGKPLAGKTGTTSDWFDAWFVGFSPDLVAGVYVGFDEPRTLGGGEVGGHVAAPIFRDFMAQALKDAPAKEFPEPPPGVMASAHIATTAPASSADSDETQWGSLAPPADEVTVLNGKTTSRDMPSSWPQDQASTAPYYASPAASAYAAPGKGGYGRTQDQASTSPYYASPAAPDYATQGRSGYGRMQQAPEYAAAPPGYAAPRRWPAYGTSAPPSYPPPRAPAYAIPGLSTPAYGYPGPAAGPRPGTGGLY
jgi:membrane peptidoglycan carboxypeptidase